MAFWDHLIQAKRKRVLPRVQKFVFLKSEKVQVSDRNRVLIVKKEKNHLIIEFSGIFENNVC